MVTLGMILRVRGGENGTFCWQQFSGRTPNLSHTLLPGNVVKIVHEEHLFEVVVEHAIPVSSKSFRNTTTIMGSKTRQCYRR